MDVGRFLREIRVEADLTQAALANRAGTSQAAVARYESGVTSPAVATLERLLAACGRPPQRRLCHCEVGLRPACRTLRLCSCSANRAVACCCAQTGHFRSGQRSEH